FDQQHTLEWTISSTQGLAVFLSPSRLFALAAGVLIVLLLYRRISILGKLTVTIWLGVLAIIVWIIVDGFLHFSWAVAFQEPGRPRGFAAGLGEAMRLAMYSYLGYYSICYIGDEVRDPGRPIPRSIFLRAA